jgi:hypothetical protein
MKKFDVCCQLSQWSFVFCQCSQVFQARKLIICSYN